jgi:hypothetical protein
MVLYEVQMPGRENTLYSKLGEENMKCYGGVGVKDSLYINPCCGSSEGMILFPTRLLTSEDECKWF